MHRLGWLFIGAGLLLALVSGWLLLSSSNAPWASSSTATPMTTRVAERLIPTAMPPTMTATVPPTPSSSAAGKTTTPHLTATPRATASSTVTATQDPVPSSTSPAEGSPATETPPASPTSTPSATPTASAASAPEPGLYTIEERIGIGVPIPPPDQYPGFQDLGIGWYLDWRTQRAPSRPAGVEYAQMVRLQGDTFRPGADELRTIAQANPGSLWLIGNEPDVIWQDNATPAEYASVYHTVYTTLKAVDPTAHVAIGGVSQPTPLRLRYLEAVLAVYQEQYGQAMPIDVWNVHNFILREERGSWGVDIPPGLPDDRGMLYDVDDNDDMEIFRRQIVDFRRWMAEHGYQDRPLIVSEYGIPMPADYGFPPQRVNAFIENTFTFFRTAADPALGYPADGYRLVQRWCWFSLADTTYPTGNLYDPQSHSLTAVGEDWKTVVRGYGLQ